MVRYAIFGRRRSMTALSPMVLAWLNTVEPATPSRRAPSMTGAGGSDRLLGTLVTEITPSRTATTSVNVPPTSTPNIVLSLRLYGVSTSREGSDADHRTERAKSRRSGAVDGVQAVDTFHGIPPTPSVRTRYRATAVAEPQAGQVWSTGSRSAYSRSWDGRGKLCIWMFLSSVRRIAGAGGFRAPLDTPSGCPVSSTGVERERSPFQYQDCMMIAHLRRGGHHHASIPVI